MLLPSVSLAVILPTIWMYLQTLDAAPYFLGLALSAFSLTGLLSGPLFGHWSDRTRTTKKIILFANFFELIGECTHVLYFHRYYLKTVLSCQKHKLHLLFYFAHFIVILLFAPQVISCTLWATPNGYYCQADWWQVSLQKVIL